ncbi:KAT8 regulatory NSL complex subunit dim gamma-tubulin 1 [Choristoneura fumiferana]|uniref:KAT8 regulatory NSL complex subunit dim gamma-tubulin 1 n=1 Tax=Choristoneura fumiferana TaxID=7141 RepID=UPI003D158DCD
MSQPPSKVIHLPKVRMLRGRAAGGIRITNVKSIKPPDPQMVKQQEENKLRAQLQKEIVSRSRTCQNKTYECHLPVVTGRQFCAQHILQDPSAPYRQCVYASGSGARCPLPAPADARDQRDPGLCYTHARAALQSRARSAAPPPPVASSETLLHQLNHYVRPERPRTSSCASSVSVVSDPAEPEPTAPDPVDPFTQIDAPAVNAAYSAAIMECGSASDSDADSVCLPPACSGPQADEDAPTDRAPLWRAGVYTAEEAVSEAKTALRSLQAAYIKQMGRLRVLLQMARLKYLRDLKAEKEQYCSINAQARGAPTTARERRQLRKLKAYAGYHRRHGVDAVLARKLQRKRAKVNDPVQNRPVPAQARCTFQEGSARCAAHAVPAAKHCLAHILHDKQQVLFVPCNDPRGLSPCRVPLPRLPPPAAGCRYHAMPPPYCVFTLKKDDSESEASVASDASHERPIGAL